MNKYTISGAVLGLVLLTGCSKVCEPKPLEGMWKDHADLIPAEGTACGGTESEGRATLKVGFEGKSGPHSFKIMSDHMTPKGWKEVRYGGSSMDSIYEKDGITLKFAVKDAKQPIIDMELSKK